MRKCKYRKECKGYYKESYTCNNKCNKRYCGYYREFEKIN